MVSQQRHEASGGSQQGSQHSGGRQRHAQPAVTPRAPAPAPRRGSRGRGSGAWRRGPVRISLTGFAAEHQHALKEKLAALGMVHEGSLRESTNVLIALHSLTPKTIAAARAGIPVVRPDWLDHCRPNAPALTEPFLLQRLGGLRLCVTRLEHSQRGEVGEACARHGGTLALTLDKSCSMLVVPNEIPDGPVGDKIPYARRHGIPCVHLRWVHRHCGPQGPCDWRQHSPWPDDSADPSVRSRADSQRAPLAPAASAGAGAATPAAPAAREAAPRPGAGVFGGLVFEAGSSVPADVVDLVTANGGEVRPDGRPPVRLRAHGGSPSAFCGACLRALPPPGGGGAGAGGAQPPVTCDWVRDCVRTGRLLPPEADPLHTPVGPRGDAAAAAVVAWLADGCADRERLQRLAEVLGARWEPAAGGTPEVTHAIVADPTVPSTRHLVCSAASAVPFGKPFHVVTPAWLEQSARAGVFVDTTPFWADCGGDSQQWASQQPAAELPAVPPPPDLDTPPPPPQPPPPPPPQQQQQQQRQGETEQPLAPPQRGSDPPAPRGSTGGGAARAAGQQTPPGSPTPDDSADAVRDSADNGDPNLQAALRRLQQAVREDSLPPYRPSAGLRPPEATPPPDASAAQSAGASLAPASLLPLSRPSRPRPTRRELGLLESPIRERPRVTELPNSIGDESQVVRYAQDVDWGPMAPPPLPPAPACPACPPESPLRQQPAAPRAAPSPIAAPAPARDSPLGAASAAAGTPRLGGPAAPSEEAAPPRPGAAPPRPGAALGGPQLPPRRRAFRFSSNALRPAEGVELPAGYAAADDLQRATHFVCSKPGKSEQFLSAVAMGLWVMRPDYLQQCISAGQWLPEEQYEWTQEHLNALVAAGTVKPMQVSSDLAGSCREWRRRGGKAFAGWQAAVRCDLAKMRPFEGIIRAGGGSTTTWRPGELGPRPSHVLYDDSIPVSEVEHWRKAAPQSYHLKADALWRHLVEPTLRLTDRSLDALAYARDRAELRKRTASQTAVCWAPFPRESQKKRPR
eukprot:TRINITY_DN11929_c1_g2_i3.p1 TRINITY_DN11929_c1_g2~~TRINITY_DN11929_c1_g2_i3.p1  ORF type:complete len:1026 (+),score=261.36 TRINITY_DN11929_c1_g2_i3:73-3150(+)